MGYAVARKTLISFSLKKIFQPEDMIDCVVKNVRNICGIYFSHIHKPEHASFSRAGH
jgi:hypothetical protein